MDKNEFIEKYNNKAFYYIGIKLYDECKEIDITNYIVYFMGKLNKEYP